MTEPRDPRDPAAVPHPMPPAPVSPPTLPPSPVASGPSPASSEPSLPATLGAVSESPPPSTWTATPAGAESPGDTGGDTSADRWGIRIALLIGIVSIFSAVVAWRASVASNEETAAEVRGMQAIAQQLQLEQRIEGYVDQDERLIGRYQEHVAAARELQAAADEVRATDAALADRLDLEAQGRHALARQLRGFFLAAIPDIAEDGSVVYDAEFVARNLRTGTVELREIQPERFQQVADRAGARATGLVAMVLVLVAALFFLTLAQLLRHGSRLSIAAIGSLLGVVGCVGFVLLEILLATG